MSQGPLCPNLTKKFQKEVSQMVNRNLPIAMLLGGLSVNLNHLKTNKVFPHQESKVCSLEDFLHMDPNNQLVYEM